MSHSYDTEGNSDGCLGDRSVNRLAEAPNGDLHLLVTFEIQAVDTITDGGNVPDAGSVDSGMRHGTSTAEYTETEFGEAVDVESLVSYLGLDFVEHELFADRFLSDVDDIVYTSRGVGTYQLLCVYSAEKGLLLVVDEDEAIQPLVGRARGLLTEA